MVAVVMAREGLSWGALLLPLTLIPLGLIWAPQDVRHDKRVIVAVLVWALAAIAVAVSASDQPALVSPVTKVCDRLWWTIECWLFG